MHRLICTAFLLYFFANAPTASALVNTISLAESKQQLSVGEPTAFILSVELSSEEKSSTAETKWEFVPESAKKWEAIGSLLVNRNSLQTLPSDAANIAKLQFTAIIAEAGNLTIPPFSVRKVGGTFAYKIEPDLKLQSSSILTKDEHGKPQWTLGLLDFGGYNLLTLTVLVLLLLAGLYFIGQKIYSLWRAKKKAKTLNAKEEALLALEELQGLVKKKITNLQQWKIFAYKLAGLLKNFCEKNYLFQTFDLTDRELIQQLQSYVAQKEDVRKIEAILQELDQVRYGTKDLDSTAAPRLLIEAKNFVEKNFIDHEKIAAEKAKGAKK